MKKNVWIMNHYAGDMPMNHGGRHYNFAKYLKQEGYAPVVFCSNAMHGKAEIFYDIPGLWQERIAKEISVPFVYVRSRTYMGNGKQRLFNVIDFYRNVKRTAKEYAAKYGKPDIIYASSIHPFTLIAGIQLAKRFGVECICEIRDLWPESLVAMFPEQFPEKKWWVKMLYRGEKWIYTKADRLIFTMEGAYNYILEQGWEKSIPRSKVAYINNGVDLESFYYNIEHCQITDSDLDDQDTFKLIYTGATRKANGLPEMMECAEILQDHPDIKFLVYGGGEDLEKLRTMCREKGLTNFVLKGPVAKKQIPYILSKSQATLLNYVAVPRVDQYGSSNNKLFEYLASGKPVISNARIAYSPIDSKCCGLFAETSSSEDYAKAILQIYKMTPEEYQTMCHNAGEAAKEYDFKSLTQKLIKVIEA